MEEEYSDGRSDIFSDVKAFYKRVLTPSGYSGHFLLMCKICESHKLMHEVTVKRNKKKSL